MKYIFIQHSCQKIYLETEVDIMHNLLRFFMLEFFECVTTVISYVLSLLTHCVKSVQIRSFSWSVFSVSLHIQSECRKIRTRKNTVFGQFSPSDIYAIWLVKTCIFLLFSTTIIQKLKESLRYKKWSGVEGCNFLSFKDEANRENNKRIIK